ncbi:MAG TPA: flagellar motor protein MotB [Alphaproteobacteria bacterium]|nr:flagellar motor protein MotB [Alphaproteobacteria bacterium]
MAATNAPVIIIKRVKKGHGGHHGGAWKVAYADFVTAMMAFFLLLWLLNATTEEQRKGISDYFAPNSVSKNTSGSGGVLGGQTLTRDGSMRRLGSAVSLAMPTPPAESEMTQPLDGESPGAGGDLDEAEKAKAKLGEDDNSEDLQRLRAKRENEAFAGAEKELRQAIQEIPELKALADSVIVDRTPEGLRIQIVDQDKMSMFALGSAVPQESTKKLLGEIEKVIAKLPNKLAISGHTDSTPYSRNSNYTNWELSSDRAQAARRMLTDTGLDPARVKQVVGRADNDPLLPNEPASPRNRRLSIVLLSDPSVAGTGSQAAAPAAPPAPPPVTRVGPSVVR